MALEVEEHLLLLVHLLLLRNLWITQATEYERFFFHLVDAVDEEEDEEEAFHHEEEEEEEEEEEVEEEADEGAGQQQVQEEQEEDSVAVGPDLLGELLQLHLRLNREVGPNLPHVIPQSLKAGHLVSWSCLLGGLSFTESTKDFKFPENHISLCFFARFVLLQFIFSEPLIPPLLRAYYIVNLAFCSLKQGP